MIDYLYAKQLEISNGWPRGLARVIFNYFDTKTNHLPVREESTEKSITG
jgi:hypothetical protein